MCLLCLQDRRVYSELGPGEEAVCFQGTVLETYYEIHQCGKNCIRAEAGLQRVKAQPARPTNQDPEDGQAAQRQQPLDRPWGWQGRGLSYGLHFLFAQGLLSWFFSPLSCLKSTWMLHSFKHLFFITILELGEPRRVWNQEKLASGA